MKTLEEQLQTSGLSFVSRWAKQLVKITPMLAPRQCNVSNQQVKLLYK